MKLQKILRDNKNNSAKNCFLQGFPPLINCYFSFLIDFRSYFDIIIP